MNDFIELPPLPEDSETPASSQWEWSSQDMQDYARAAIKADRQQRGESTFKLGDHVRKTKGSNWRGHVVGTYSTVLNPEGYAVESDTETGSVQIYPAHALELVS